jgi:DNA-directed RNA polymerase subunit K/omega
VKNEREVLYRFLESVAAGERAIARLIQAEAEQIEAFTGREMLNPTGPALREAAEYQAQVARFIESVTETQKTYLRLTEMLEQMLSPEEEEYEDNE